jgi:hypothetical protein
MRSVWSLLLIALGVFVAAFLTRQLLVPDVVAIADAETVQPLWALETAFLLRTIENIAVMGFALTLAAIALNRFSSRAH